MATAHALPFKGLRVFISRKDFTPQFIEAALDMLKENGAEVCICANISCNASSDFHILPSSQHEKVAEYLSHGCNIVGPDCLVGCAKEHRPFPRRGYTCCLAMEGVKILATGFEKAEKAEIEKLVTSMCGEIESKAITNITFIIAKDVLAAKYKFSLNNLRKPILKIDWLFQCWREHRLVPYEPFRMPPFAGLTICATNIPLEERKEIEDACIKNGGSYSADLTKKCTHLIANVPQGDKFKVARRWGTVKIVNRQWFGQSLASKACLDEDLFPVNAGKEKAMTISQVSGPPPYISSLENRKSEIVMSSATSVVSNTVSSDRVQCFETSNDCTRPETTLQDEEQSNFLRRSEESEFDEENMYLSNCRVYFSGFTAPDLRKYVNMIRDGGGTRFMEFNDRVTHVIAGKLTDSAQKEIRQNGSMNIIQVVGPLWLEECHGQRKEVAITQKHILPDGFLSKGSNSQEKLSVDGVHQQLSRNQSLGHEFDKSASCLEQFAKDNLEQFAKDKKDSTLRDRTFAGESHLLHNNDKEEQHGSQQSHAKEWKYSGLPCSSEQKSRGGNKVQLDVVNFSNTGKMSSLSNGLGSDAIFKGYIFAIHTSFPMERRAEIVQWVIEGGGSMEKEGSLQKDAKRKIDFLVVSHGSKLTAAMMMQAKPVSSHWIRFCLEEKKLLSPDSHVLYQPLQCQVPFPGFQGLRICVSQYEEKDRLLLRNLCFVLEAKFNEKLSKKITHLLCKVKDGQKYHAACNWGIEVATADWLFACVSKDKFLPLINFQPRELSASEKNTGNLGMTQCPSQTAHLVSGKASSQWSTQTDASQSQEAKRVPKGSAKKSQSLVDASVAHLSERNKYFVSMQALPSQDEAPFLDPWDEQTARWSECDDTKHKNTVHEEKFIPTSQDKGDSSNSKAVQLSPRSTAAYYKSTSNQCASLSECGDPSDLDQQTTSATDKENHHSSDVAAAIEGLLAQTSKLKGNGLKGLGLDQEISPEHTTLKRTREEPCFKRPKRQALSSEKAEELGTSKSPLRDLPAFDESQLESQIIGYDEDHTGKHLIMERVRTRSMSTTDWSKSAAWRTDGLGRLFKVAEANK